MSTVNIGGKLIGDDQPCFIVAEIGINHNGDVDLAKRLISVAVAAGCDAVKFQKRTVEVVYTAEELAKPRENPFGPTNGDLKYGLEFGQEEYEEINGRKYVSEICLQLWDDPQINWDGKNLGCCRNFWGDFGGNAFADGLSACLNHEKMGYARDMLLGLKPPRDDIPCSTCELYQGMQAHSDWIAIKPS